MLASSKKSSIRKNWQQDLANDLKEEKNYGPITHIAGADFRTSGFSRISEERVRALAEAPIGQIRKLFEKME